MDQRAGYAQYSTPILSGKSTVSRMGVFIWPIPFIHKEGLYNNPTVCESGV
jgi:hypothetical protein